MIYTRIHTRDISPAQDTSTPELLFRFFISLRPLPQYVLLNLSRARLWQGLHNLHLPGHHEATDVTIILRPLNDLFTQLLVICAIFGCHESFRPLAPVRVGNGADAYFENCGVRREHGFEGNRGDVFAACYLR